MWTNVPKPTETSVITVSGQAEPWGVLVAITSVTGAGSTSVTSGWTDIPKSTNSVWISVSKPTT